MYFLIKKKKKKKKTVFIVFCINFQWKLNALQRLFLFTCIPVVPVLQFEGVKLWYIHILCLPGTLIVRYIPPLDKVVTVILLIHTKRNKTTGTA